MLFLKRKKGLIVIQHKHNYNKIDYFDALKLTFYYRIENNKKYFGFIQKDYYTVNNLLDKSMKELFSKYTSTIKNEIRRSKRENVQIGFIKDIEDFRKFYDCFANEKGIPKADEALLNGYQKNLVITCATFDNKTLSAHAYIIDKQSSIVRLLYSSSIRFNKDVDLNFISRANKFLHYKDMEYFKVKGFLTYDFGGYANNTQEIQTQGINRFKLSFGGEIVRYYDYYSYLSVLSSWVLNLMNSFENKIIKIIKKIK